VSIGKYVAKPRTPLWTHTCSLEELVLGYVGDITVEFGYDLCPLDELVLCYVGDITVEIGYDMCPLDELVLCYIWDITVEAVATC